MNQTLIEASLKIRDHAHSPYSHIKIGAAILWTNNKISTGANVENASYGATVCAERVAIWSGLMNHPNEKIKTVVVASDASPPWPPCGMCRQVIAEFCTASTEVIAVNPEGETIKTKFSELFPSAFTPEHLK